MKYSKIIFGLLLKYGSYRTNAYLEISYSKIRFSCNISFRIKSQLLLIKGFEGVGNKLRKLAFLQACQFY